MARNWRHFLLKKKYILSKKRPQKEYKMLKKIFDKITLKKRWWRSFRCPVKKPWVTSVFGEVRYITFGGGSPHRGIDYGANYGEPVKAAAPGKVVFAAYTHVRGNLIIIDHGYGVFTIYMHLDKIWVYKGQWVQTGRKIGAIGSTGLSTGPHLHFSVRVGNINVDPNEWMRRAILSWERWHLLKN